MFIIPGEVGAKLEMFVSSPLTLSSIYPHVLDYITHIIILSSTYKIACVWRLIFEIGFRNTMGWCLIQQGPRQIKWHMAKKIQKICVQPYIILRYFACLEKCLEMGQFLISCKHNLS